MLRDVILVVILGRVKGDCRRQLRDDGRIPHAGHLGQHLARHAFLLGRLVKDDGTELRTDIVALAIQGGGIVQREKYFQQVVVSDDGGIEFQAHHFRVARIARAYLFIRGIGQAAARVAGRDAHHAAHLCIHGSEAPETATAEYRHFRLLMHDVLPQCCYDLSFHYCNAKCMWPAQRRLKRRVAHRTYGHVGHDCAGAADFWHNVSKQTGHP